MTPASEPHPPTPPAAARRRILWSARITVAGGILVLAGIALAMALHAGWFGGTPDARKFSLLFDYLSMLGRTCNYDGNSNLAASLVFNAALVGTGILYAFFWPGRSHFIPGARIRRTVVICGWLMAAGLASLGLAPENLFPRLHPLLTGPPVVFGTVATLLCLRASDPRFDGRRATRLTVAVFGLAVAVAAVLRLLVALGQLHHRPCLPIMQKVLIFLIVAWTFRQAWLMQRTVRRPVTAP
ncbi:MAG: hypothetical protein WC708_02620 [Lentisphaeria bacterium]